MNNNLNALIAAPPIQTPLMGTVQQAIPSSLSPSPTNQPNLAQVLAQVGAVEVPPPESLLHKFGDVAQDVGAGFADPYYNLANLVRSGVAKTGLPVPTPFVPPKAHDPHSMSAFMGDIMGWIAPFATTEKVVGELAPGLIKLAQDTPSIIPAIAKVLGNPTIARTAITGGATGALYGTPGHRALSAGISAGTAGTFHALGKVVPPLFAKTRIGPTARKLAKKFKIPFGIGNPYQKITQTILDHYHTLTREASNKYDKLFGRVGAMDKPTISIPPAAEEPALSTVEKAYKKMYEGLSPQDKRVFIHPSLVGTDPAAERVTDIKFRGKLPGSSEGSVLPHRFGRLSDFENYNKFYQDLTETEKKSFLSPLKLIKGKLPGGLTAQDVHFMTSKLNKKAVQYATGNDPVQSTLWGRASSAMKADLRKKLSQISPEVSDEYQDAQNFWQANVLPFHQHGAFRKIIKHIGTNLKEPVEYEDNAVDEHQFSKDLLDKMKNFVDWHGTDPAVLKPKLVPSANNQDITQFLSLQNLLKGGTPGEARDIVGQVSRQILHNDYVDNTTGALKKDKLVDFLKHYNTFSPDQNNYMWGDRSQEALDTLHTHIKKLKDNSKIMKAIHAAVGAVIGHTLGASLLGTRAALGGDVVGFLGAEPIIKGLQRVSEAFEPPDITALLKKLIESPSMNRSPSRIPTGLAIGAANLAT